MVKNHIGKIRPIYTFTLILTVMNLACGFWVFLSLYGIFQQSFIIQPQLK